MLRTWPLRLRQTVDWLMARRPAALTLALTWLSFLPIALLVLWLATSERQLGEPVRWDAAQGQACLDGAQPCERHVQAIGPATAAAPADEGPPAGLIVLDKRLSAPASHFFTSYPDRADYSQRHRALHDLLSADQVRLYLSDGSQPLNVPITRGWQQTTPTLVLHLLLASIAWASGLAHALWRREMRYAMLALSSVSFALAMTLSALESTHGLAWPLGLAGPLNQLARLCVLLSFAGFTGFVLCVPRRFLTAWQVASLPLLACALNAADHLGWFPAPGWGHQAVVVAWGLTLIAAMRYQWQSSRSPLLRAFMQWLALGAALLTLRLTLIFALPDAIEDRQDFIDITLVPFKLYWLLLLLASPAVGLADGLLRRLFLWAMAALMIVLADALLVLVMQQEMALLSSLLIAGVLYLPLRNWLLQILLGRAPLRLEEHIEALYATARAAERSDAALNAAWLNLMQRVFEPESAQTMNRPPAPSHITESGVSLWAPMHESTGQGVLMRHAKGGRRLFSKQDADFVRHCATILNRLVESDRAAQRARQEERERIANDLHDDLGGRLMHLAHGSSGSDWRRYAQETLTEMRLITHGLARESAPLGELLADLRAEFMPRLQASDVRAHWHSSVAIDDTRRLRPEAALAIARILSEGIRNAMVHGAPTAIEVRFEEQSHQWVLSVSHNGRETDPATWKQGMGTRSIQRRALRLGGSADWQARPGGGVELRVLLDHTILEQ